MQYVSGQIAMHHTKMSYWYFWNWIFYASLPAGMQSL